MEKTIIKAYDYRYISEIPEFKNELPKGILNKRKADVGGTFAALNYPTNYIIVVPSLSLIDSIKADKNMAYAIFDIQGCSNEEDYLIYLDENDIHKIVVTYDSFEKLFSWSKDIDIINYKILVDEFHVILGSYGFRKKAIDSLNKSLENFSHVTYMSATPIDDTFIHLILKNQPYIEISWNDNSMINVKRHETHNTLATTMSLIKRFLSEDGLEMTQINGSLEKVEELYIFINSVKDIATTIKSINLKQEDVKVICTDSNKNKIVLKNAAVAISNITDANKRVNFFTSRAFEGCNLFTNNGLVVAVSNSAKKHTLIDVQTSLYQIHGRIRFNKESQNIFRHIILHIYSTNNNLHPDLNHKNFLDKAKNRILTKEIDSNNIISTYNKITPEEKVTYRKQIEKEPFFTEYNEDKDKYEFSKIMEAYEVYQFELIYHVYSNGITVRESYGKDYFKTNNSVDSICVNNDIEIKLALTVSFRSLLKNYVILRKEDKDFSAIDKYEKEYPIFKIAYNKFGATGLASYNYSEKIIKLNLYAFSKDTVNNVISTVFKFLELGDTMLISSKAFKLKLIDEYKLLNIDSKKIGITVTKVISLCTIYEFKQKKITENTVRVRGYEVLKKDSCMFNFFERYDDYDSSEYLPTKVIT